MLQLSNLFTDHAVLQRNMPVPVWGWAAPGECVTIRLNRVETTGRADDAGFFRLRLEPQEAGGPYPLFVSTANGDAVESRDIHLGEVWFAGGQSNMEMPLTGLEEPLPTDDLARLEFHTPTRLFKVPRAVDLRPHRQVEAAWLPPSPENHSQWSALAAFFAARIGKQLQIPVGIISCNYGGSMIEAWSSYEALRANPDMIALLTEYERKIGVADYPGWRGIPEPVDFRDSSQVEAAMLKRARQVLDASGNPPSGGRELPGFADSHWRECNVPGDWHRMFPSSGIVWYRKTVEIPPHWAHRPLRLELGAIDKADITYFNGVPVGATGTPRDVAFWNTPRCYRVPPESVVPGPAVIAVRAASILTGAGLTGPASAMRLGCLDPEDGDSIPLSGRWKAEMSEDWSALTPATRVVPMGYGCPNSCHLLFDTMVEPLIPFAMRGILWYQGEGNAGRYYEYRQLMRRLIVDWRQRWGQPELAFYQVLLAGLECSGALRFPELRQAQLDAANDTGTGVVSAVDLGDAARIHAPRKRELGERLADIVLAAARGNGGETCGPKLVQAELIGDSRLRLAFRHAAGLHCTGSELYGFELAGADYRFIPADAQIAGETVIVRSSIVKPEFVRFAWCDYPHPFHLYNAAGLPALPFQVGLTSGRWQCLP